MYKYKRTRTVFPHRDAKLFRYFEWRWKSLIEAFKERLKIEKDVLVLVTGKTGCISGDTMIKISRHKNTTTRTIKTWYDKMHGTPPDNKIKAWDKTLPLFIRSFNGKNIRLHKVKDIVYSGEKEVFKLKLKNGLSIKATADHKIMTREGWKELQNLKENDLIMCDAPNATPKNRKRIKLRDIGLNVGKNHPYNIQPNKQIEVHRLIYESYMNNFNLTEYLDILLNEPEQCKQLKFINPKEFVIHHKDGNHYNNSIDNLEKIKESEHHLRHNNYSNFSQGDPKFSEWLSTKRMGVEDTYDIVCEDPHHNFVADNIVIHNSGKSHLTGNFCLRHFAKEPNFILNDGSMMFDKDNFITTPEEFSVKMISNKGSVLWVDEGRSSVSRRDWYDKIHKTILGRKNTNRKLRNITFLLLPFEKEIDPNMVSHATLWFWVRRGTVEIYASAPDFKGSKGLDIQSILDREEKYKKENPNCRIVLPYIHPEFIGRLHFKALSAGFQREYDKLVEEKDAVGQLTEEEMVKFGMMEDISPEKKIQDMIQAIIKGEIEDKKEVWAILKKDTKLPDSKLLKQLNFYLKLEDMPNFAKLFK